MHKILREVVFWNRIFIYHLNLRICFKQKRTYVKLLTWMLATKENVDKFQCSVCWLTYPHRENKGLICPNIFRCIYIHTYRMFFKVQYNLADIETNLKMWQTEYFQGFERVFLWKLCWKKQNKEQLEGFFLMDDIKIMSNHSYFTWHDELGSSARYNFWSSLN